MPESAPHDSPLFIERIAQAIHERYCRNQTGLKPASDPALRPWAALDEALKASNRSQAADITAKLRAIGCIAVPGDGSNGFVFTSAELELLAEREHQRWVAERRSNGWTLGPARDPARLVTPHLVPYRDLPEEIRELDREAVRSIPSLLLEVGLEVRRLS